MTDLLTLRAKAHTWDRALELYAQVRLSGTSYWNPERLEGLTEGSKPKGGTWRVLATVDCRRRCSKCGQTYLVMAHEVVRDSCPYCSATGDNLKWVDSRGCEVSGPPTEATMLRGGVPDGYSSQDWAIDFSRWVVAVAGGEVLGWVEAYAVDNYSEKDVADLVGRSEAQVRWEFRRLKMAWRGVAPCPRAEGVKTAPTGA